MKSNTVVVVGDRFGPAMVSPERLFDRAIDPATRILFGPISQCSYDPGTCEFQLTPDRIAVSVHSQDVMPDELRLAAESLFSDLENVRMAIAVHGVGLNCEVALPVSEGNGVDISNSLARLDELKAIVGGPSSATAKTSLNYVLNGVICTLKVEPELASDGQNLFVAINGHQNVEQSSALSDTLAAFEMMRDHVGTVHDNIRRAFL